ncbi:MAG: VanW family protein [Eubacteriales bacterium]
MARKLFCEISPLTYKISTQKCIALRRLKDLRGDANFSETKENIQLPVSVYRHNSLIRRKLGNVDLHLQENKAVNLALAAPLLNGIIISPGETFSLWHLIGNCNEKKGYLLGLTITKNGPGQGIGGGMCQMSNLIHWLVLHSPLTIVEHHHHNGVDLFPDFNRQVPFGVGTSILYNYLDYRVRNNTADTYQLIVFTDEEYLHGELRCNAEQKVGFHIRAEEEYFSFENGVYFRNNVITRKAVNKTTGEQITKEVIMLNHAKVMYDEEFVDKSKLRVIAG